jgi:hypothetical protein
LFHRNWSTGAPVILVLVIVEFGVAVHEVDNCEDGAKLFYDDETLDIFGGSDWSWRVAALLLGLLILN